MLKYICNVGQENNYYYILYLQYEKSALLEKVKVNYIC